MYKWDTEELISQIGLILKLNRLKRGLSQFQLGNEIDLSKDYIGLIERGKVNPTMEIVVRICNFLEVEITSLFSQMNVGERKELEEEIQTLERQSKNQNKKKS